MPELPEVETIRRRLESTIYRRRITDVIIRRQSLREPIPADLSQRLRGQHITAVSRRAKYLLIQTSSPTWIIHLGMTGNLLLSSSPPTAKHAHVGICLNREEFLIYTDPRRFGRMTLTDDQPMTHRWLRDIGPEPLSADFTTQYLRVAIANKTTPIKTALMDAHIVAGIGNIYASEALFAAGINPRTKAGKISPIRLQRLITAIQHTLTRALQAGGSTLRDFVDSNGQPGYFQHQWSVYQRADLPCPSCQTPIKHCRQSGRATYYCHRCQR